MAFIKVCCPQCSHRGDVAVARLPGILSCSACGRVDLVLAPIEEITAAPIDTAKKTKVLRGPRKRALSPGGKRILVPRAPVPA